MRQKGRRVAAMLEINLREEGRKRVERKLKRKKEKKRENNGQAARDWSRDRD